MQKPTPLAPWPNDGASRVYVLPGAFVNWSIVVVAGFALMVIAFPVFSHACTMCKKPADLSNAKQLGLALIMFTNDHHDRLPDTKNQDEVKRDLAPYLKTANIWHTVETPVVQFHFNAGLAGSDISDIPNADRIMMIYPENPDSNGGRSVCFANGHGQTLSEEEFQQVLMREPSLLKRAALKEGE